MSIRFRGDRSTALVLALAFSLALAPIFPSPDAWGQDQGGISYEEYVRVFPPAPVNVRVQVIDGKVTVSWGRPEPADASQQLAYDPAIAGYRVYRIGAGGNETVVGETAGTSFVDAAARSAATRRYAVTAVQRSGHESGLSAEAVLIVP